MLVRRPASEWLDVPHFERPERLARTISVLEQAGVIAKLDRLESRVATRAGARADPRAGDDRADRGRLRAAPLRDDRAGGAGRPRFLGRGAARGRQRARGRPTRCSTARPSNGFALVRPPGHHATADRADGLLPVQQRRDRRPPRAARARRRAGRDRRLGRAPRQRHPGRSSGRPVGPVRLPAPGRPLPGRPRRRSRARRRRGARGDRQRAAAGRDAATRATRSRSSASSSRPFATSRPICCSSPPARTRPRPTRSGG